jgi:ribosome production factor 2
MEEQEHHDIPKAKTHKGRVFLQNKEPKLVEDNKHCLFINTNKSNEVLRMVLTDLFVGRKDYSKKLGKKNDIKDVFTTPDSIEFLCEKNNCAMFTTATDIKKRPMNLIMGNLFENKLLDLVEFEVMNFLNVDFFKGDTNIDACMKPVVIFQGDIFETDFEFARIKKLFFEFFKMYDIEDVSIGLLKRIIILTAAGDKVIKIRTFELNNHSEHIFKDKLQMKEIGPSLDLKVRRVKLATDEVYKIACRQPRTKSKTRSKNEATNVLLEKRGRVYMTSQDLNKMSLKQYNKQIKRKVALKKLENEGKEATTDDSAKDSKKTKKKVSKKKQKSEELGAEES